MTYRCIAVDDEYPATLVVENYAKKIPSLVLLATFTKAKEALEYLEENEVEIIFLDIQMPDINGIEFIQSLRKEYQVIFTTAYDQYAIDGFNLDVSDYLLKPFSFDRFSQAVNKVCKVIDLERNDSSEIKNISKDKEYITVKSDYKLHKIHLDDIDYIEGLKAYVSIFVEGKRIIVLESLKNLENTLPESMFIRVHKSYILPIARIKIMEGNMLELGEKKIPIGKSYKEIVLKKVFDQ